MMARAGAGRRGLVWAAVGAAVLIGGLVALLATRPGTDPTSPTPSGTASATSPTSSEAPTSRPTADGAVVDSSVTDRGWTPEPITTDADTYVRAALAAASTFDTTKSSRDAWLDYLDTWFTPDTRYATQAEREDVMRGAKLELRQAVVLPETRWDSLASEDGRVVARVDRDVDFEPVPSDETGDMTIGTADVTLTYTSTDGAGGELSYDETVRVSIQVLCGPGSIPTPNSAQRAGDCKVVRWFSGTLEP